ncbi:MAG: hypothetical protein KF774_06465 [Planctomyces sp.]|nr:hypothetical protein [Planctomyces sp.]
MVLAIATTGCDIFGTASRRDSGLTDRQFLPSVPAPRDVINLEVILIDRTPGDPLTGDSLWRSLNQAAGSLSNRVQLKEAGLQYGIAPSTPPFALQALLNTDRSAGSGPTQRHAVPIPTGGSTMITTGQLAGARTIAGADKSRPRAIEVADAHCIFQVAAERVQDGWVRITLLPEIHHGTQKLRPRANDRDWVPANTREIEPYLDRQFSVELNTGEYVVVGPAGTDPNSLGTLFFRGGDLESRQQRLMIVRLIGMHEVQPVRTSPPTSTFGARAN